MRENIEAAKDALRAAITALDDWTNIYASDMCDEARVKEARDRISESGTLGYIATTVEQCRNALKGLEYD